jgi:LAO/AO transport system kinase
MQLPNAGDDLQAIKKGVMELADLVLINKMDIDPDAATRAQAQITSSLRLFGLHGNPEHAHFNQSIWHPRVMPLSALKNLGVEEFWNAVKDFKSIQEANGQLIQRRKEQANAWMWERIEAGLKQRFRNHPVISQELPRLSKEVNEGVLAASVAARRLLDLFKQ